MNVQIKFPRLHLTSKALVALGHHGQVVVRQVLDSVALDMAVSAARKSATRSAKVSSVNKFWDSGPRARRHVFFRLLHKDGRKPSRQLIDSDLARRKAASMSQLGFARAGWIPAIAALSHAMGVPMKRPAGLEKFSAVKMARYGGADTTGGKRKAARVWNMVGAARHLDRRQWAKPRTHPWTGDNVIAPGLAKSWKLNAPKIQHRIEQRLKRAIERLRYL